MSEADWQKRVLGAARLYKWRSFHVPTLRPDRHGRLQAMTPGFPDLILLRGPRLVVSELKSETGRLRPGQQDWLDSFAAAGAETYLWRPSDWEEVVRVLGRRD